MMELRRSQYSHEALRGLGAGSRAQLAKILRTTPEIITPEAAANALGESQLTTSKLLARWAKQGWLQRVRRGIYVPVPLESVRADSAPEDSWVIAQAAFAPCFVAGWSAAEHWSLTEQVFRTVLVGTARRPRKRELELGGTVFALRTVSKDKFFGLKTVWRGRTRVQITDPTRTIADLLADPRLGGGVRSTVDMLENYLRSKDHCDLQLLVEYAERLGNRAVFKRLGFLLVQLAPDQKEAIAECSRRLSKGYAKLDPTLPSQRLVTQWGLWVPAGW